MMDHNAGLVILSFAIAYFASLTALDMGTRLRKAEGKARNLWLTGSSVVLGGGIWSMHFVAMLAMHAGVPVAYDFGLTALSLVIAIVIVGVGFHVVTRANPSLIRQICAGAIVGCGVAAMHYTGMAALILPGHVEYNLLIVAVSLLIAIVAATAALWLTLNLRHLWQRLGAAGVMAVAVCGMHYTGMAATSIHVTPGFGQTADPMSTFMLAAAVCMGVFLILCLAMVCVFVDRRFELMAEREAESLREANALLRLQIDQKEAIARELTTSNEELSLTRNSIRNLLDNSDQGFLTIGADLLVEPQSSAACAEIFGGPPAGRAILDLLCRDASAEICSDLRAILESVFKENEDYVRALKIDLLPTAFKLGERSLKVAYKYLEAHGQLMLVVTDTTETTRLTQQVERERHNLEMIVHAMTESETFDALVEDYRTFLTRELPGLAEDIERSVSTGELYRRLHTFKGLLSQYSFHWSPKRLHDMETRLAETEDWTLEGARESFAAAPLIAALEQDLAVVANTLGDAPGGARGFSPQRLAVLSRNARALLADAESLSIAPPIRAMMAEIAQAGMIDVKAALGLHGRGAPALAARLDRLVGPISVSGDDVQLPPERYREFFRSLVHVYRNAVDHGLEGPEERLAAGKDEAGRICCAVRAGDDRVEIEIRDDGRGVDRSTLEAKLLEQGLSLEEVSAFPIEDLLFRQGLSSCGEASETSGRGVGLAAVKHELDKIGGSVAVTSTPGRGTTFVFAVPRQGDEVANVAKFERRATS